jgi:hypothetical protein
MTIPSHDLVIAETRAWVRKAVVGLNLCPFARGVEGKGQIRYVVSDATDVETLLATLCVELQRLADTDPTVVETTLLMHPQVLGDFEDFNDFLELADAAVEELDLGGILQVASFHPDFQFADTAPADITNATNRSPYPTLHLLREDSVDKAVAAFPQAEKIYETNMATMEQLGRAGWDRLKAEWEAEARTEVASVGFDAGPGPEESPDADTNADTDADGGAGDGGTAPGRER